MPDLTHAQQRVQPGDLIRVEGSISAYRVLRVHADGVEAHAIGGLVHAVYFCPWSTIALPDPPKAKPGVRYRHKPTGNKGVGVVDGTIYFSPVSPACQFDLDEWEEVEP